MKSTCCLLTFLVVLIHTVMSNAETETIEFLPEIITEAALIDPEAGGVLAAARWTNIAYNGQVYWIGILSLGDGVSDARIGVYAPASTGSLRRCLLAQSWTAGNLQPEIDSDSGVLTLREHGQSGLKGLPIVTCNLRSVGTQQSVEKKGAFRVQAVPSSRHSESEPPISIELHFADGRSAKSIAPDLPDLVLFKSHTHIHVKISNGSTNALLLWQPGCPIGDDAMVLEFRDPDQPGLVRRSHPVRFYTGGMGVPKTLRLAPKADMVVDVDFSEWGIPFDMEGGETIVVEMRALYCSRSLESHEILADIPRERVWKGVTTSSWEKVRIMNRTGEAVKATHPRRTVVLISWKPPGKNWHFNFLWGTNGLKPVEVLVDPTSAFAGLDELEPALSRLLAAWPLCGPAPAAEEGTMYWSHLSEEPIPVAMANELAEYCEKNNLQLKNPDGPFASNLSRDMVLDIARASASKHSINLAEYDMIDCKFERGEDGNEWSVFYKKKPPTPPGSHFVVVVNDKTKEPRFVAGE